MDGSDRGSDEQDRSLKRTGSLRSADYSDMYQQPASLQLEALLGARKGQQLGRPTAPAAGRGGLLGCGAGGPIDHEAPRRRLSHGRLMTSHPHNTGHVPNDDQACCFQAVPMWPVDGLHLISILSLCIRREISANVPAGWRAPPRAPSLASPAGPPPPPTP